MGTLEDILSRRSIRKFTGEPVSETDLREILMAAMSAPSAGNEQPWHFVVVDERLILDEIPKHHPYSAMVREAPLAVLVCADLDLETRPGYWVQDCAAATENLLLAVHAKGLGAVWLGVYPREERVKGLSGLLGLPERVVPFSLVPVGRPAEKKPPADRYDPARIHFNRW